MIYLQSTAIVYEDGLKYRLVAPVFYMLQEKYEFTGEFKHPQSYYQLLKDDTGRWWIIAHVGCCWDGPTKYWDYEWMMHPSLIHDILHWLIGWGVLSEEHNDTIDRELELLILNSKAKIPWWQGGNMSKPLRARMVRRATGLANEKYRADKSNDFKVKKVGI